MRNRAKCKACNDIIESFTIADYVSCKCGEIEIWGGNQQAYCAAKQWNNFLRIDDMGNEIVPKILKKEEEQVNELPKVHTKQSLIKIFEEYVDGIEKMNENMLLIPINHADLHTFMSVILEIIKKT